MRIYTYSYTRMLCARARVCVYTYAWGLMQSKGFPFSFLWSAWMSLESRAQDSMLYFRKSMVFAWWMYFAERFDFLFRASVYTILIWDLQNLKYILQARLVYRKYLVNIKIYPWKSLWNKIVTCTIYIYGTWREKKNFSRETGTWWRRDNPPGKIKPIHLKLGSDATFLHLLISFLQQATRKLPEVGANFNKMPGASSWNSQRKSITHRVPSLRYIRHE